MTDYTKRALAVLEHVARGWMPAGAVETLTAATELMRAAALPNNSNPGQNNPGQNNPGQNNPGQNNPGRFAAENAFWDNYAATPKDAEAERAYCRGVAWEIVDHESDHTYPSDIVARTRAAARADGAEELAALHAEVRRLREDMDHASEVLTGDILRLDVKLTNLRTAAEHQYDENAGDDAEANADFWAAIEASR